MLDNGLGKQKENIKAKGTQKEKWKGNEFQMFLVFWLVFKYHIFVMCSIMQTILELETMNFGDGMGNMQFHKVPVKVPYWQAILMYLIFTQNSKVLECIQSSI